MSKKGIWVSIVAGVMLLGGLVAYKVYEKPDLSIAVSQNIRQNIDFTIYFPEKLPEGYTTKTNSVEYKGGVLFTQFINDDQTVFLSQQAKLQDPSIATLKGFSALPVGIGKAVIGEQDGVSAVIIDTKTSVITVSGGGAVSKDQLGLFAKKLRSLN